MTQRMMTKQEIYNKVRKHLLTQGRKAMTDDAGCVYRTPEGLQCAAGCLIDPEHYNSNLEGFACVHNDVVKALHRSGVGQDALGLVEVLQVVHDDASVEDWPQRLDAVARAHGLEVF